MQRAIVLLANGRPRHAKLYKGPLKPVHARAYPSSGCVHLHRGVLYLQRHGGVGGPVDVGPVGALAVRVEQRVHSREADAVGEGLRWTGRAARRYT